jgi:hypothetical protein
MYGRPDQVFGERDVAVLTLKQELEQQGKRRT